MLQLDNPLYGKLKQSSGGSGGATLGTKTITSNGTYKATDDNLDGYSEVEVAISGGTSNYKIEKQIYTPAENEMEHTFTHNLGVVPDLILIFAANSPTSQGSLRCLFGKKSGVFELDEQSYYTKQYAASINYCGSSGSDIVQLNNPYINQANDSSFNFYSQQSSLIHLKAGCTYYIVLMAGVDE